MKIAVYTLQIIIISFYGCTSTIEDKKIKPKENSKYFELYPEITSLLNGESYNLDGNYWSLKLANDSTCLIEWSNGKTKKRTKTFFSFREARHFKCTWFNKDFIALKSHSGSDSWFEVYLPLDSIKQEIIIENTLTQDIKENLVISEGRNDTILIIHILKNGMSMEILESEFKCESAFWHYCIDSVAVKNYELFYKLTSPSGSQKSKTVSLGFGFAECGH